MPNWFTAPIGSLPLACCPPKSLQDWHPLTSLLKPPPIKWYLSLHPPFIFYPKKDCTHPLFSILRKLCYFPITGIDARANDPTSPPLPSLQRKKRSQRSEWPQAPTSAFSLSLCSRTWLSVVTAITWHPDISCGHFWHHSTSPETQHQGNSPMSGGKDAGVTFTSHVTSVWSLADERLHTFCLWGLVGWGHRGCRWGAREKEKHWPFQTACGETQDLEFEFNRLK